MSETDRALGLVTRLDARIPSIKRRDRGLSAGQLLVAMSAWLQEITGIDRGNGRGRRTITRLRSELINIPARVIHPGRTTVLRLPPGPNLLTTVLPRLQALPSG